MQRIRFGFSKGEPVKFIGHLDMARMWERALRRAGLPVTYSQGYNPQLKIQFASALPVGFSSRAEVADLWLDETLPVGDLTARLAVQLPRGVELFDVSEVDLALPALQSQLRQAEYAVYVHLPGEAERLAAVVDAFLAAAEVPKTRLRDGKTYDLRPVIDDVHIVDATPDGWVTFFVRVASRPGATGRPDELLEAMGYDDAPRRIERTRLIFAAAGEAAGTTEPAGEEGIEDEG